MAKHTIKGICCLCGKFGELHEEHVPPQAAFNKSSIIEYSLDNDLTQRKSKGRTKQGGVSGYTLCPSCNNNTGSWYATEYVKWARTCFAILETARRSGRTEVTFGLLKVSPLKFIKQLVPQLVKDEGRS